MSHDIKESDPAKSGSDGIALVDERAPRFGQTISLSILLLGIGLQEPLFILGLAVILNAALLSGWRVNVYGFLWRHVMIPVVGAPDEMEPATPHRFAKLMGASMSAVATMLLFGAPVVGISGLALVGYGVAVMHACAAAIGGIGNYCIGCRMYKQVAFFRRLGVV